MGKVEATNDYVIILYKRQERQNAKISKVFLGRMYLRFGKLICKLLLEFSQNASR